MIDECKAKAQLIQELAELRESMAKSEAAVQSDATDRARRGCALEQEAAERRQAEETLRRTAEHLRLINDSSHDMVYSYDLSNRFVSANRSLCELLQLTEEQIAGKTYYELGFPEEQCREWGKLHRQVRETNRTVTELASVPLPDDPPLSGGPESAARRPRIRYRHRRHHHGYHGTHGGGTSAARE
jgi:PAS domain-containing protein